MDMDLLLNDQIRKNVASLIAQPTHAIIIQAPPGAGKPTLAKYIAGEVLNTKNLDNSPYFLHISPLDNIISIDVIRTIRSFIGLKTTGKGELRRAILIEDADAMTGAAQNALLKVLEEPPEDTIVILTVSRPNQLLKTVYSRCRVLLLQPVSKELALSFFTAKSFELNEIEKSFHISGGQPGLMTALLDDKAEHPLKASITKAKSLVIMTTFERLTEVDALSKDKESLPTLLYALQRIYRSLLEQAALKDRVIDLNTAHKALKTLNEAEARLEHNASPKLLLTDLFLSL